MPHARRLRSLFASLLLVAAAAGMLYLFWPSSLGGCSTFTIVSGNSMEPTYSTGDFVWSRCGEPAVGDIVVYTPPDTGGAHVIHRIVGGDGTEGWVLRGDNNDFLDPWNPDDSHVAGIATVHIPRLGSILYSLSNPWIWGSLLILAAAIFLWPRDPETSGTASETETDGAVAEAEPVAEPEPMEEPTLVSTQAKGELL